MRTASPTKPPDTRDAGAAGRGAVLLRYVLVSSLVRGADGGAAVGLISLTLRHTGERGGGAAIGGLLAAALTVPHLLGPVLARPLDRATDDRWMLATAFALFGVALAAGTLLLGRAPTAVAMMCMLLAGACGPFKTGGLSSKVGHLIPADEWSQRRAEGWDSATYGAAAVIGPAIVAAMSGTAGPAAALCALGALSAVGGALTWTLPRVAGSRAEATAPSLFAGLSALARVGPLRRTTTATVLTALATGGLMVVAGTLGVTFHPGAGAALALAFGVGSLVGSVGAVIFPFVGEPERHVRRLVAVTALLLMLCACAPTYPTALVAFGAAGATGAMLMTATLAVRSTYSPAGARAQVFMSMAGIKTAAASAGTAVVGATVSHGPRPVLIVAAATVGVATIIVHADRFRARRRSSESISG